jgi:hypothetical protein
MIGGTKGEKIKVNKSELLSILETNRCKHRQIFEMSVEEEVFLSEQDFRCYDDWDGKQKFLASSRSYSARAASLLDDMERG